jgi:DNA-binding MarR family transcriptional regulator
LTEVLISTENRYVLEFNAGGVSFQTTLRVKDACLCLHVQRAARALARQFDEAFRPFGITNGQFSLLMSLNRPEPPPMGRVAELLALDRTTLTAALKPLERRGLVKMLPHPRDRRSKLLKLTGKGSQVLAKAMPVWESEHAKLDALLHGDAETLRKMLAAFL